MRSSIIILSSLFCAVMANDSVEIRIVEKEKLTLQYYEKARPFLRGIIEVTLRNKSDKTREFLLWDNSHNIQFLRGDSAVTLVHSCDVVGVAKFGASDFPGVERVILKAGDKRTVLYDTWECSSPFSAKTLPSFYKGGVYKVQFRILPYDLSIKRGSIKATKHVDIIAEWTQLLNSKEYWQGALVSNKIEVRLKPKKLKDPIFPIE